MQRLIVSHILTKYKVICRNSFFHEDQYFQHFPGPALTPTLTDLRGGQTLLGQLEDLLFDIIRCELQPLQVKVK